VDGLPKPPVTTSVYKHNTAVEMIRKWGLMSLTVSSENGTGVDRSPGINRFSLLSVSLMAASTCLKPCT
jgi:hypothetical protein